MTYYFKTLTIFLKLGDYIYRKSQALEDEFSHVSPDESLDDQIQQCIEEAQTIIADSSLNKDDCTVFLNKHRQKPKPAIVSLIASAVYDELYRDNTYTSDSDLARRVGLVLDDDLVKGALSARIEMAELFKNLSLVFDDNGSVRAGLAVMRWLTGSNRYVSPRMIREMICDQPETARNASRRPNKGSTKLRQHIQKIPVLKPHVIVAEIEKLGFVGQENAKRSMALMAFRHIDRLRKIYIEGVDPDSLPPKCNLLLCGPTGCGKSYLAELIWGRIFNGAICHALIDTTTLTERGYVGEDTSTILTRLIMSANGDPAAASCGVIFLDEFDKLASSRASLNSLSGTYYKDVSGFGVQRELLKLLEGCEVHVPDNLKVRTGRRCTMRTENIAFCCAGAFSHFNRTVHQNDHSTIGFISGKTDNENRFSNKLSKEDIGLARNFELAGIMPELFSRFTSVVSFDPLSSETLCSILKRNAAASYAHELSLHKIKLKISDDVYQFVVMQAQERESGARGLNAILAEHLENALFEAYSFDNVSSVRLVLDGEEIRCKLTKRRITRKNSASRQPAREKKSCTAFT